MSLWREAPASPVRTVTAESRTQSPPRLWELNRSCWFSFWFSGFWRALSKGTAWAGFYCEMLLLLAQPKPWGRVVPFWYVSGFFMAKTFGCPLRLACANTCALLAVMRPSVLGAQSPMLRPPPTGRSAPVTMLASSDSSHATAATASFGVTRLGERDRRGHLPEVGVRGGGNKQK